eukprot:COSAG01_NODE_1545_length_9958_cov_14.982963_5_plen_54_part_00
MLGCGGRRGAACAGLLADVIPERAVCAGRGSARTTRCFNNCGRFETTSSRSER